MIYDLTNTNLGYIPGEAHQGLPSEDDSYWAQVWTGLRQQVPFILLGPGFAPAEAYWNIYTDNADAVATVFETVPEVKAKVKDVLVNTLQLIPNTVNTANWFVKNLPWIAGVGALLYAFTLYKTK